MPLLALDSLKAPANSQDDSSWTSPNEHYEQARENPEPSRLHPALGEQQRWAVILAGGDGTRLRSLTHLICGDDRPKQFCKVFGRQSLLEQTRQRAARSVPARQTIFALTETHRRFYESEPGLSQSHRLVQPRNRGTAPPIILSLQYIASQAPGALVAVLPSDHYYSNEAAFTESLEAAFRLAHANPQSIVLLGAQPNGPEVEFGWIQLGLPSAGKNVFRVRGFEEKPSPEVAEHLWNSGALWNTFVMVGTTTAFLWMTFTTLPELVNTLDDSLPLDAEKGELRVSSSSYNTIPTTDYSRQVLAPNAHRLLALRLQDLDWHDLGRPERVVSVVRSCSLERPPWIYAWEGARRAARTPLFQI